MLKPKSTVGLLLAITCSVIVIVFGIYFYSPQPMNTPSNDRSGEQGTANNDDSVHPRVRQSPDAGMQPINMTLFRRKESDPYTLDKDDLLFIGPDIASGGFPAPVREDGTIMFPIVDDQYVSFNVKGKTLREVEDDIKKAHSGNGPDFKVCVQLGRKRKYRVYVQRNDLPDYWATVQSSGAMSRNMKSSGHTLYLEEGRNDVWNALNLTGGPPGLDGKYHIVIAHEPYDPTDPEKNVRRIPLRMVEGDKRTFSEKDITLRDGAIVFVETTTTQDDKLGSR